jgi:hypothetical protein
MNGELPHGVSAPDTAEAIVGWRAWTLRSAGDSVQLGSIAHRGSGWVARTTMHATCAIAPGRHRAPLPGCTCGVYATKAATGLAQHAASTNAAVIGTVSLWGTVVEHRAGYRAEYAYPQRLTLVCARCLASCRSSRPTTVFLAQGGLLSPSCEAHARDRLGPRVAVEEIQARLLDAYAVDGLAPDALASSGFSKAPARPAGAHPLVTAAPARPRSGGFGSVIVLALVMVFVLRQCGVLVPQTRYVVTPVRDEPSPAVTLEDDAPIAPPIDPSPPSGIEDIEPARTPHPRPALFLIVCGEPLDGVATVRRCGAPAAELLGLVSSPRSSRSDCGRRPGYTRKPRFSICWLGVRGVTYGPLSLPGVHLQQLRARFDADADTT